MFVVKDQGELWLYQDRDPIDVLTYGGWKVVISVTAENIDGFEGTLNFTINKFGGFHFDSYPAFVMLRFLPPRSRRA